MTTYVSEFFDPTDDLIERRARLGLMSEIPDMRAYAAAWSQLADEFMAIGFEVNAGYCKARADYYGQHPGGAYVRQVEQPFAVLTQVSA